MKVRYEPSRTFVDSYHIVSPISNSETHLAQEPICLWWRRSRVELGLKHDSSLWVSSKPLCLFSTEGAKVQNGMLPIVDPYV
jgi:hypothetical protein